MVYFKLLASLVNVKQEVEKRFSEENSFFMDDDDENL